MSSEGAPIRRKIVILGDGAVGKTSLMRRYLQEGFDTSEPDMPVQRSVEISMELDGQSVIMTVWDLLGHKGYDDMNPSGLYGSAGVIIVTDLTRRKTLKNTLAAQGPALGLAPEEVLAALKALDIDPGRRGETLSVAQFVILANDLLTKRRGRRR